MKLKDQLDFGYSCYSSEKAFRFREIRNDAFTKIRNDAFTMSYESEGYIIILQ